jgi:putative transcription factor
MPCELCGKDSDKLTTVRIEGTMLKVCSDCSKFGDDVRPGTKEAPNRVIIQSRLDNRERRMKTKDVYQSEEEVIELADDYGERIRKGRETMGLKQERKEIKPDDAMVNKLEKALGIALMEKVPLIKTEKRAMSNKGMTLEDFIKSSKK